MTVLTQAPIIKIADNIWKANKNHCQKDCSGYVKQVAAALNVSLPNDLANGLIDYLAASPAWQNLGQDAARAASLAAQGYFVIGGLKAHHHGHVVVVVPGWSATKHPMGFWGSIRGVAFARENASLSQAWIHSDLQKVSYFAIFVPALVSGPA